MRIEVTQGCIDRGQRDDFGECPVALALEESFASTEIGVYSDRITINGNDFALPKVVGEFIHSFDNGGIVVPFSFELGDPL